MEELDIALVFASRCVVRVSPGKQTSKIQDEFPKKEAPAHACTGALSSCETMRWPFTRASHESLD